MKNSDYEAIIKNLLNGEYNISECLDRFNKSNRIQEATLEYLFSLPESKEVIFARVIVLNQTYSTGLSSNILSKEKHNTARDNNKKYAIDVQHVAHHIWNKCEPINECIEGERFSDAVFYIMQAVVGEDKQMFNNIYSFATKYCCWKYKGDKVVPIYDSYLHGMLKAYYEVKKLGKLPNIRIEKSDSDGKGYDEYIACVKEVMKEKCFSDLPPKVVDSVLWQIAKERDNVSGNPWELVNWEVSE